jgi:hypothetical protein
MVLGALWACSSGGGGCDGGNNAAPSGQSTGLSVGSGGTGGTGEAVSFQGLGKKAPGDAPQSAEKAKTNALAAALGGSGSNAAPGAAPAAPAAAPAGSGAPIKSVICGGYPNLAADCTKDPAFSVIKKKCCPDGTVDRCQAVPGGARLIGKGCAMSGP